MNRETKITALLLIVKIKEMAIFTRNEITEDVPENVSLKIMSISHIVKFSIFNKVISASSREK